MVITWLCTGCWGVMWVTIVNLVFDVRQKTNV